MFERHLWTQAQHLGMLRAQLHVSLELLHTVLEAAYEGRMECLLRAAARADECSRFSRALSDTLDAQAWAANTRKAPDYFMRLADVCEAKGCLRKPILTRGE